MECFRCHASETCIVDSREKEGGLAVMRRRECLSCGQRFSTMERAIPDPPGKPRGRKRPHVVEREAAYFAAAIPVGSDP